MAYTGNGSVLTRSGTVSGVTQMEYSERCAKIDVTTLGSVNKCYEAGQVERTITATILGETDLVVGDTPAVVTCTFQGTAAVPSGSLKFVCTRADTDTPLDGPITSNVEFVETTT